MLVYRWLYIACVFAGAVIQLDIVWNIADSMNALMAVPNLIALLLLSGVLVAETRKYLWEGRLDEAAEELVPEIETEPMLEDESDETPALD